MAQFMREVNKNRYYFSIEDYGKLTDAPFEYYRNQAVRDRELKANWDAHFRLYNETENILERIEDDDDCSLFPLYRNLGEDDEDFIFATREEAEKEYTWHIERDVADRMYNL